MPLTVESKALGGRVIVVTTHKLCPLVQSPIKQFGPSCVSESQRHFSYSGIKIVSLSYSASLLFLRHFSFILFSFSFFNLHFHFFISFHFISFHFISFHFISFHFISFPFSFPFPFSFSFSY
jgi:hypothetical protein